MDGPSSEAETTTALSLDNLPVEVVLYICRFLSSKDIRSISSVCKRLRDILSDENVYKWWMRIKFKGYPSVPTAQIKDWEDVFYNFNRQCEIWGEPCNVIKVTMPMAHTYEIDAITLTRCGSICISGSRDRSLALWHVGDLCCGRQMDPKFVKSNAHAGWIWDMEVSNRNLCTASWDQFVKMWDIEYGFTLLNCFNCYCACLAVKCTPDILAVGLYNRGVCIFDPRTSCDPIHKYKLHKGAVLSLDKFNDYLLSGGEDNLICVYDLRAQKFFKRITVDTKSPNRVMKMKISCESDGLYVVQGDGHMHLYDPNTFENYGTWQITNDQRVNSMSRTPASVVVCTCEGFLYSVLATNPPIAIEKTVTDNIGEPINLNINNEVVAIGGTRGMQIRLPTDHPILSTT